MLGSSRRKAGFDDFAKRCTSVRFRLLMTTKNQAAAPEGFERTVATRDMPLLLGEIAGAQSLAKSRRSLRKGSVTRHLSHNRIKGFFGGDKE